MSDHSMSLVPPTLLPPGVKDDRQDAFVGVLDASLKSIGLQKFVMTNPMTVDAELLPFMVREFSVQEFVEPGLKEEFVRLLLSRAYELHEKKGYIEGARLGLNLLGIEVDWVQWWQETPKADHNTHVVKITFEDLLFDNGLLGDQRHRNAVIRIVRATQRWSQSVSVTFGFKSRATTSVGAIARLGGVVRTMALKPSNQNEHAIPVVAALSATGGVHHIKGLAA